MADPEHIAQSAKRASRKLAILSEAARNHALEAVYHALKDAKPQILTANAADMDAARGNISASDLSRLDLSKPGVFANMAEGVLEVSKLKDEIGKVTMKRELDDGFILERVTCPIGVMLIIFESRPEVIVNLSALALKSANAAIVKGGKESKQTFKVISDTITQALASTQVPPDAVQTVFSREAVDPLLKLDKYIDVVIPRGGKELIKHIRKLATMPVMSHLDGLCHMYVHHDADPEMATSLVIDSKTSYPAVCNAVEVLLVHENLLRTTLAIMSRALLAKNVELRCDPASRAALQDTLSPEEKSKLVSAGPNDFDTEFLSLILAVKTISAPSTNDHVDAIEEAITHINEHGSHHTDAIVTSSPEAAKAFQSGVDSACKFWNCSTRFADGMRFGFGAEIGISTNKIHARGPVGLEGLTIYEYRVCGNGQTVAMYAKADDGPQRQYTHRDLEI